MKQYIEEHCGIHLDDGKEYLIETRLSDLVIESGCSSFQEFHLKARSDVAGKLRDRIIDAMTTNETLWFRDETAWQYIREIAVPTLLDKAEKTGRARVWSAAASTGQESYSLLMLLDEQARARGKPALLDRIEIIATDISTSALFIAMSARYDSFSINRGLPADKKSRYFTQEGNVWVFDQELKKHVRFKKFNLQDSLASMGIFDLIMCRYVTIYFSEQFKRTVFSKIAKALQPGGVLLLGATESLRGYSDEFNISYHNRALINIKK
ncbi:MAG: protein-glutamate O-methyltransferase CheR [Candidatus Latescibacteria bacterium]|nr:protein-glutamate O-methyltransferase CheR [Candidatus Latescibacterota bacterium]